MIKSLTMLAALTSGLLTACMTDDADQLADTSSNVLGVEPEEIDYECDPTTPDEVAARDQETRGVEPEEIDARCTEPDEPTVTPIKVSPTWPKR